MLLNKIPLLILAHYYISRRGFIGVGVGEVDVNLATNLCVVRSCIDLKESLFLLSSLL